MIVYHPRELQHAKEGQNWKQSAYREELWDFAYKQDRLQWVGACEGCTWARARLRGRVGRGTGSEQLCCLFVLSIQSESGGCHKWTDHGCLLNEDWECHQGRWGSFHDWIIQKPCSSPLSQLLICLLSSENIWLDCSSQIVVFQHSLPFCVLRVNHRDHWRGSPWKNAHLPELQTMRRGVGPAHRQKLPLNGDVKRHT